MGVYIPPWEWAILRGGNEHLIIKYRDTAVICAKVTEPIEMPFRLWAWMGPLNHELDGRRDPYEKGEFWVDCKV